MRSPRSNVSCMEMKSISLYRFFALSLIFVTANELYAKADEICEIAYSRCKAENKPLLPANPVLVRGNQIASISGTTGNYRLSFDIVPVGTVWDWGSILHFTNGGNCCNFGNRSPGIWFWPSNTRLHVRVGDSTDGNWGIDTVALPLNTRTNITLECKGADAKLTVGGSVYTARQPTRRFSAGNLTVYAGDPWYASANAAVYNLNYEILPADGLNAG